jgi:hypothetical protein
MTNEKFEMRNGKSSPLSRCCEVQLRQGQAGMLVLLSRFEDAIEGCLGCAAKFSEAAG